MTGALSEKRKFTHGNRCAHRQASGEIQRDQWRDTRGTSGEIQRDHVTTGEALPQPEGHVALPEASGFQKASFFSRPLREREPVPARGG